MRSVTRRRFLAAAGGAAAIALSPRTRLAAATLDRGGHLSEIVAARRILDRHGVFEHGGDVSARDGRASFSRIESAAPGARSHRVGDLGSDRPGPTIHRAIYRARPDVGAIVLARSRSVTSIAASGAPLRAIGYGSEFLASGTAVFDARGVTVWSAERADAMARALGAAPALLVRGVGVVVVASTLAEVVARGLYAGASARLQAGAMGLA